MIGQIKHYNEKKGYGFIVDDEGTDRFFHKSNLHTKTIPKKEDPVIFEPIVLPKGLGATEVRIVTTPGDSEQSSGSSHRGRVFAFDITTQILLTWPESNLRTRLFRLQSHHRQDAYDTLKKLYGRKGVTPIFNRQDF